MKINASLSKAVGASGAGVNMGRVVEAMDAQLMDALHQTRKFELVSRSDLNEILSEQQLADSGNIDADDKAAARAFELAGCKYLVVMTVDDFQDYQEVATFEGIGERATKRVIRFSAVAKIYETTKGTLFESTNFQLGNKEISPLKSFVDSNGRLDDQLLIEMARMMADRVANRVVDVVFPAKILTVIDRVATINRGDGTTIGIGQLWEVYLQGEELTDPDTGEILGREEVLVGRIRISSVQPKFSKGEILEDKGVEKGCVVRPAEPGEPPR